jgi:hypothetical protein
MLSASVRGSAAKMTPLGWKLTSPNIGREVASRPATYLMFQLARPLPHRIRGTELAAHTFAKSASKRFCYTADIPQSTDWS